MAWTAPRTWTVGEVVTAAMMNAHVRDNELALAGVTGIIPAAGSTPTAGTGFTYTHSATGVYAFTFSPAFAATPVVVANATDITTTVVTCIVTSRSASGCTIQTRTADNAQVDQPFNFKAFLVV